MEQLIQLSSLLNFKTHQQALLNTIKTILNAFQNFYYQKKIQSIADILEIPNQSQKYITEICSYDIETCSIPVFNELSQLLMKENIFIGPKLICVNVSQQCFNVIQEVETQSKKHNLQGENFVQLFKEWGLFKLLNAVGCCLNSQNGSFEQLYLIHIKKLFQNINLNLLITDLLKVQATYPPTFKENFVLINDYLYELGVRTDLTAFTFISFLNRQTILKQKMYLKEFVKINQNKYKQGQKNCILELYKPSLNCNKNDLQFIEENVISEYVPDTDRQSIRLSKLSEINLIPYKQQKQNETSQQLFKISQGTISSLDYKIDAITMIKELFSVSGENQSEVLLNLKLLIKGRNIKALLQYRFFVIPQKALQQHDLILRKANKYFSTKDQFPELSQFLLQIMSVNGTIKDLNIFMHYFNSSMIDCLTYKVGSLRNAIEEMIKLEQIQEHEYMLSMQLFDKIIDVQRGVREIINQCQIEFGVYNLNCIFPQFVEYASMTLRDLLDKVHVLNFNSLKEMVINEIKLLVFDKFREFGFQETIIEQELSVFNHNVLLGATQRIFNNHFPDKMILEKMFHLMNLQDLYSLVFNGNQFNMHHNLLIFILRNMNQYTSFRQVVCFKFITAMIKFFKENPVLDTYYWKVNENEFLDFEGGYLTHFQDILPTQQRPFAQHLKLLHIMVFGTNQSLTQGQEYDQMINDIVVFQVLLCNEQRRFFGSFLLRDVFYQLQLFADSVKNNDRSIFRDIYNNIITSIIGRGIEKSFKTRINCLKDLLIDCMDEMQTEQI